MSSVIDPLSLQCAFEVCIDSEDNMYLIFRKSDKTYAVQLYTEERDMLLRATGNAMECLVRLKVRTEGN